ncbi:MAG TPA: DASS family sodium-coupled anion symporter [Cyclobacteriaceae bacterium]|nr:DASS family sodium-coupled anion symporter [Cyclobacteriaceae bacterium]
MNNWLTKSKIIGLVLGPLFFISILIFATPGKLSEHSIIVLALGAWVITWWVTEAMPIPVSALLPMVVLPLMGVSTVKEATAPYGDPVIFLFMGGFILGLGLERHNLHQRIALNLIKLTGTSGNGIIMGFMISTALISMWISNTATAIMMLPIAASVTSLLAKETGQEDDPRFKKFATGLMLAIAYAASIGGMATIIGTPPNVVMVGFMKRFYNLDVSFTRWMVVGIPLMILALIACYVIITKILYRNHLPSIQGSKELIHKKLEALGKLAKEEKLVLMVFSITCFFWIFRQNINGLIGKNVFDDTTIAMAGGILMFLLPVDFKSQKFLLEWNDMKELPWGILLLFGGGLCLADGMEKSGLVQIVGDYFSHQDNINASLLVFALTAIAMGMTELMSNVALVTIFVPVVFGIADGFHINPIWLAMPVTFAASCAFMMPISTPPNAVLFASGHIKMKDMIKTGILLNLCCLVIITILALTVMQWIF